MPRGAGRASRRRRALQGGAQQRPGRRRRMRAALLPPRRRLRATGRRQRGALLFREGRQARRRVPRRRPPHRGAQAGRRWGAVTATAADGVAAYFGDLQDRLTAALEGADGAARFREDSWTRSGGGGGRTRVLADGALFEKAGVSFSDVHGELRPEMERALPGEGARFRATGVSLVLHPKSPRVPTVHANVRRIQRGARAWFGGGTDLTPYYVVPADAAHFHRTLRATCEAHDPSFHRRFKRWCDDYFFLPHRNEPRGVGGIFFDYLGAGAETTAGQPAPEPVSAR